MLHSSPSQGMQQLCPQWEIISLLNSQAAFPSVELWFWRQLSPQNQHLTGKLKLLALKIGRTRLQVSGRPNYTWNCFLRVGQCRSERSVSMISRNLVLYFSLLPSGELPMQPEYTHNYQPACDFQGHICLPISRIQDLLSACPPHLVLKAASGLLS